MVSVLLTTSLVGSPLFLASQPLWLAGSSLMPGVSTVVLLHFLICLLGNVLPFLSCLCFQGLAILI